MYMYEYMYILHIYMCMYMSIAFEIDQDPADHLIHGLLRPYSAVSFANF